MKRPQSHKFDKICGKPINVSEMLIMGITKKWKISFWCIKSKCFVSALKYEFDKITKVNNDIASILIRQWNWFQ